MCTCQFFFAHPGVSRSFDNHDWPATKHKHSTRSWLAKYLVYSVFSTTRPCQTFQRVLYLCQRCHFRRPVSVTHSLETRGNLADTHTNYQHYILIIITLSLIIVTNSQDELSYLTLGKQPYNNNSGHSYSTIFYQRWAHRALQDQQKCVQ